MTLKEITYTKEWDDLITYTTKNLPFEHYDKIHSLVVDIIKTCIAMAKSEEESRGEI